MGDQPARAGLDGGDAAIEGEALLTESCGPRDEVVSLPILAFDRRDRRLRPGRPSATP
jgi:hypothetical protein